MIQAEVPSKEYAEEQNLLMDYGQDVTDKLEEAVRRIGMDAFSEEQIVLIQYEGEDIPLAYKVVRDNNIIRSNRIPSKEADNKEVYIYNCKGKKQKVNKKRTP